MPQAGFKPGQKSAHTRLLFDELTLSPELINRMIILLILFFITTANRFYILEIKIGLFW